MQGITFQGVPGNYFLDTWFALNPIGHNFQVWQLITYQFMHGGFTHILFNMFALWMFGIEIENLWGSKKFIYYYLLCGVVAGLFQIFLTPLLTGLVGPTIGASGAIYGVLIAFGVLFPNRYIFLYFFIPVKAKYLITFLILIEFFAISPGSNIAHLAHLGGALAGFIYILLDKNSNAAIKNIFNTSSFKIKKPYNPFGGISDSFKHKEENVQEAKFYEINDEDKKEDISQEQIDKILDKISQSGYQNLTDKEKKILFEASKKMK
jgi:membrane associated rhomboid family serine protease